MNLSVNNQADPHQGSNEAIVNTMSLYFEILIPIVCAAMLLSRIAITALPVLELIRLSDAITVTNKRTNATANRTSL